MGFMLLLLTGHWVVAPLVGLPSGVAFGLGHNYVHQPREFWRAWSMELMGVSRDAWHCRHNLQHHMYTNTEKDNHYPGAPPVFTPNEAWGLHRVLHRWLYGGLLPVFAFFFLVPGLWFSGSFQWWQLRMSSRKYNYKLNQQQQNDNQCTTKPRMREPSSFLWRMILPSQLVLLIAVHGTQWGLGLFTLMCGVCGVWFFILGIANHYDGEIWSESESMCSLDYSDFASRQMKATCDIGAGGESFLGSLKYLFFNYHLVHHLFPNIDAGHHPEIDQIVDEVAKDCGVRDHHRRGNLWSLYWQMVNTMCATKTKDS